MPVVLVQHGSVALPRALPASPSSASLRASRAAARRGRSASVAPLRASSAQPPKQQPALIRGMRLLAGALAAPAREVLSADERSARPRERSTSPPKRERSAEKLKFRTIFISDLHLGTAGCQAQPLLDFLRETECERMYLVGDIVDLWESSSGRVYWPQSHSDVIQKLLKKARKGTKIVAMPGNHDEALRDYLQDTNIELGENITVTLETEHTTADGRRFLVLHGDRCDVIRHVRTDLHYKVKNILYRLFQAFNRVVKFWRRLLRLPYWSLATTVNTNVKVAAELIANYEAALAHEALRSGMDGVICGHIHHPSMRDIGGVTYASCGDWVDSCSALVEHFDGRLEVLRWLDIAPLYAGNAGVREPKSAALDDIFA